MSQKLNERISTLEERLKQLKNQKQRSEQRRRTSESRNARKEDTRRKILVGAIVISMVERGEIVRSEYTRWLEEGLKRDDDRALFQLPQLPGSS